MMGHMTTSDSTVAWIGAGGVIIGAAVGAIASWITAAVTSRHAAMNARDDRRRAAYLAFLGALDEILALFLTAGNFEQELDANPAFADSVRQASSSIASTSVAVLLAGSQRARNVVKGIENARWGVLGALIDPTRRENLGQFMQQFANVQAEIANIADEELNEPQPWWKIWRDQSATTTSTPAGTHDPEPTG
jgi:hypothetical protein